MLDDIKKSFVELNFRQPLKFTSVVIEETDEKDFGVTLLATVLHSLEFYVFFSIILSAVNAQLTPTVAIGRSRFRSSTPCYIQEKKKIHINFARRARYFFFFF